jgi:hypothetical protein
MDVAIHFRCPLEEAPEADALDPQEFPEFQKPDLSHLDAGKGFDAPKQIRAAPGRDAVTAGGVPKKAEHGAHGSEYSVRETEKSPGISVSADTVVTS